MLAGIDHDIKLWSPTAARRQVPGPEARRVMQENRTAQGTASANIVISPMVLARLIGFAAPRCAALVCSGLQAFLLQVHLGLSKEWLVCQWQSLF